MRSIVLLLALVCAIATYAEPAFATRETLRARLDSS